MTAEPLTQQDGLARWRARTEQLIAICQTTLAVFILVLYAAAVSAETSGGMVLFAKVAIAAFPLICFARLHLFSILY